MNPILYPAGETAFADNGLGILPDASRCIVTEERNGMFELELDYPISGLHYADIKLRSLILAKPNPVDNPQPFRVYRITRPMGGMVTIYAQHLSYDLAGITVTPFTAGSAIAALTALKNHAAEDCPFSFWSDKQTAATMTVKAPESIRALLGGQQGSVLDVYGGEYKFDRYLVRLYGSRGMDRGVTIRYGKNLTSLEQDENCAGVYTGVHPFWLDNSGGQLVALPERVLKAPGTYTFSRIKPLDLSGEWQDAPTVEALRARAERYMRENNIGVPSVSLDVSFVQLEQTEEYKDKALLERVELCDTVRVEFPSLGVSAAAKVSKTVYDVLRGRYESVSLGDARASITDTILDQQRELLEKPSVTSMQQAILASTAAILGAKGGALRILDTDGDGMVDTLYLGDNADPALAKKVWRFNYEGWGASTHGYNGPFEMAATLDVGMVAEFIKAGFLDADRIKVGSATLTATLDGMESTVETVDGNVTRLTQRVGGIETEVSNAKGQVTKVEQKVDGLTLSAANGEDGTSSTLSLKSGQATLSSANINFNGLVSFSDLSNTGGKTKIDGGNITAGKIQSANGEVYFDLDGNEIAASVLKSNVFSDPSNKENIITEVTVGDYEFQSDNGTKKYRGLRITELTDENKSGALYLGFLRSDFAYKKDSSLISSKGALGIISNNSKQYAAEEYSGISFSSDSGLGEESFGRKLGTITIDAGMRAIMHIVGGYYDEYPGKVDIHVPTYVQNILVHSDRSLKKDISEFQESALIKISKTKVYKYHLKSTKSSPNIQLKSHRLNMGLIFDEAPVEIKFDIGSKSKGIDLYAMCSMLWKGVQELTERIERLEETVNG
ncbi:MAG: hypothetical protein HFG26_08785 [Provencibacterium sp.]|nr:hypothetical protein [Provencibacterium sp.]